ncbi:hypothetical protein [Mycoplasma buteonis]|uniref:hypothetical protein n=1 Tax=Mycoplasma buteonis TaxID=171280 RepID=UPI00055C2142|nr:hypothetical protein [Mycoplasma buteonis]
MNVYLDTATEDFVLILFDDNFKVLDSVLLQGYKKKVQLITEQFEMLLNKNKLKVQDITGLYTNLGPGFFTGVRSSLVYFRTISLLTGAKTFFTNSFKLLKNQKPDLEMLILDAQGNKKYCFETKNIFYDENTIQVLETEQVAMKIDYQAIINNFANYKNCFEEILAMQAEPLYIKKPQIGGH